MVNLKYFCFLAAFLAALFAFAGRVKAAERCETQYGGGETCVRTGELQIDKEIFDPKEWEYVDNMGPDDHLFKTAEEISFKLKIKNVGDETLFNIDVRDSLPKYLFFSGGSDGEFEIDDLNPDESTQRTVKATVVAESQLPGDKSLICTVNTAEAKTGDEHDKDTAQFCIGKKVLGITTLPKTGSNLLLIAGILTLISSLSGLALVRVKV